MNLSALVGGGAEIIGPEATLEDAAEAMVASGVGSLGVIDERRLVGILTERDIMQAVAEGADPVDELVRDWMSQSPDVFSPDVEVHEAAQWLLEAGYRHMPVMDEAGELLGVVSIRDLLWAIVEGG